MGFLDRVWGAWTNSADEELIQMLREFEIDYPYDEEFLYAIPLIENAIIDGDYNSAWILFQETAPVTIAPMDWDLFEEYLIEADLRK